MAAKRRNLFLYLTLACFLGLIAIFFVDGYMGIYDTTYVTAGELERKIDADFWLQQDRFWSTGINRGEKAFFRYELENNLLSSYTADVEVSVWRMQEKVLEVTSQTIAVSPFAKGQLEWQIDTTGLLPNNALPEQSYEYTVTIKRGETERRIIMHVNPATYPIKAPVPVR